MSRWEIVKSTAGWGDSRYSVVRVNANGTRKEVRARWTGLSCIDAQVIAEELNRAYEMGREELPIFDIDLGD